MTEFVTTGRLEGGQVFMRNVKAMKQELSTWKDGEVLITIEKARAARSEQQNRWYWGCVLKHLADHTGYTADELHEYCKERFNAKPMLIQDADGVVVDERRIGLSTTKLNKITFGEYCEQIRQWAAADLGVNIPDPDPDWREREDAA